MSNAADGRGLVTDQFDDDEIEWDDENDPSDENREDEDGLSPIESLVDAGSDIFDGDGDDASNDGSIDDDDDRD
jgi:hypothetical protein